MKHWRPARRFFALAALALAGTFACDSSDSDPGPPGCPKFSQVTIWNKCLPCHSSTKTTAADRMDAAMGVNFDQYESAKANGELARDWVMAGLMPPSPMAPANEAEKASLQAWVACGMPQ